MTLRVRLSVVPFGDESQEREIEVINISNLGPSNIETSEYLYVIEHNAYKEGDPLSPTIVHKRSDGALTLVKKAIEALGY